MRGTMWKQHCHTAVQKVGLKPIGDEWPSLYFHPTLKLLVCPDEEEVSGATRGALAPRAASILMKLLCAAPICRFHDLIYRAVCRCGLCGCCESRKSTPGAHMNTQGPHTRFPLGIKQKARVLIKSLYT